MKATILQSNFAKALGQVSRIVSNRTTLPVLGNVLISAKKGKMLLSATDLEIGITTLLAGKVEEEGEITVPARLLSDFILNNSDDTVIISTAETKVNLKSEHYEANINGISAEEFPTVPEAPGEGGSKIKRLDFVDAVKKVIIAAATDETRPTLAGVYFCFSDRKLTLVATDSYRLAEKKISLEEKTEESKIIVPARTMAEILRLASTSENIESITLLAVENQVYFLLGEVLVVSRVIEGAFPNYRQIIPSSFKINVEVDHKDFLAAIKMASLFAKDAANNISLKTKETAVVVASALSQIGSATSSLPAIVSGGEVTASFNARYILDILQVIPAGKIALKLNDSSSAAMVVPDKDKDYIYIVMPLKVEG